MSALERYNPPSTLADMERLAGHFAHSGLFGNSPKTQGELITKMVAGAENGIPPFAAASGIHIIQGKAEVGADLLARMVKESPKYNYRVRKLDDEACVLVFFEDGEECGESSFTMLDAKRAGLASGMYGKYPRNMLFARAMSNGVAWYCPDVSSSRLYAQGEISEQAQPERNGHETVIHDVTVEPAPVLAPVLEQPVEPSPTPIAGEPAAIVAEQLAAIGADGRKRIKAYLSENDLVAGGDRRSADTWIRSIIDAWGGSGDEDPYYCDLADVLATIEKVRPPSTPLTRQEEADEKADAESEALFEQHAPKAQGALTPRMYSSDAPS